MMRYSFRELPTYEERKHFNEVSTLYKKIENLQPNVSIASSSVGRLLPQQLVQRSQRQRRAHYKLIEQENKRLLKSLCEIARQPSKNLMDMGLAKTDKTVCHYRNDFRQQQLRTPAFRSIKHRDLQHQFSHQPQQFPQTQTVTSVKNHAPLQPTKQQITPASSAITKPSSTNFPSEFSTVSQARSTELKSRRESQLRLPIGRMFPRMKGTNISNGHRKALGKDDRFEKEQRIEKLLELLDNSEDLSGRSWLTTNFIRREETDEDELGFEKSFNLVKDETNHSPSVEMSPWIITEPSPPRRRLHNNDDDDEKLLLYGIINKLGVAIEKASATRMVDITET